MKSALVTGSAGFVGQHVTRRLREDGWLVQLSDVRDRMDCRRLFATDTYTFRFDLVVHCAAVVGGRETISGDPLAVAENLAIDSDMFRWAVRTKQRRVVYFSSSAAYPTWPQESGNSRPLREDYLGLADYDGEAWQPDGTYGWAKLTGEYLVRYAEAEGVPVHVFRPFSGYGPGQATSYPFPAYVERARRRDDPFTVWGDGTQTRDFVHVDDIVGAVMAAVAQDYREPLNIGTGRATSFDDLARMVTTAAGYSPEIAHDLSKPTGPMHRVADVTRLHDLYEPKITLEQGIAEALGEPR